MSGGSFYRGVKGATLYPVQPPELRTVLPWIEQLAFGAVAGFVAGYALKKVGKLLALALGLLFIAVQLLAWAGFVSVNWVQVQETVDPLLRSDSLERGWRGLVGLLTHNLPFAAAFVPGLIIGVRRG